MKQQQTHRPRDQKEGVEEGNGVGVWDQHMQTIIYKMDKQEGPTVQQREQYSISYINHNEKIFKVM